MTIHQIREANINTYLAVVRACADCGHADSAALYARMLARYVMRSVYNRSWINAMTAHYNPARFARWQGR